MPCWAVVLAVRGAEPSVERRCWGCLVMAFCLLGQLGCPLPSPPTILLGQTLGHCAGVKKLPYNQ